MIIQELHLRLQFIVSVKKEQIRRVIAQLLSFKAQSCGKCSETFIAVFPALTLKEHHALRSNGETATAFPPREVPWMLLHSMKAISD